MLLRHKTSTGVPNVPQARSSGGTGNHRFNDQRIRADPLQRITLVKKQFSDTRHKGKCLGWNRTPDADDNTKAATPVKTTGNTASGSTTPIDRS
jgi:hypothetical protein